MDEQALLATDEGTPLGESRPSTARCHQIRAPLTAARLRPFAEGAVRVAELRAGKERRAAAGRPARPRA